MKSDRIYMTGVEFMTQFGAQQPSMTNYDLREVGIDVRDEHYASLIGNLVSKGLLEITPTCSGVYYSNGTSTGGFRLSLSRSGNKFLSDYFAFA